jgi:hypothetical protein
MEKWGINSTTNFYNFSGLYVFWWFGPKQYLENAVHDHLIQGKQYKAVNDDRRYELIGQAAPVEDVPGRVKSHLIQPVRYDFKWTADRFGERTALYAGKASGVFDRVKAHLQWQQQFAQFHASTDDERGARVLARHSGRQQLRAGFEYVFQNVIEKQRKEYLNAYVGLTVYPSPADAVSFRFYAEDYLIGTLRPAFNVDTER